MPEDAGKKKYIKDFLQTVQKGEGLIEDIRIERKVKLPGTDGQGCVARSLSGHSISNLTELLEDDIKYSFDERYFSFRFVAAVVGSGKTSLLTYLEQLITNHDVYRKFAVVVRFDLSALLKIYGDHTLSIKLYCHILSYTFWNLLNNQQFDESVRSKAIEILHLLLEPAQVAELQSINNFSISFSPKFKKYIAASGVDFEELLFYIISEINKVEPRITFVYLSDELDALQEYPTELQETRSLFKSLIKGVYQRFQAKAPLLIYLVGTSDNVRSFIKDDSVIESLIGTDVIELNKGYSDEFARIRQKIDDRIEGAYQRYQTFDKAWKEIQAITIKSENNLRAFCKGYASSVLEVHEKYFQEAPEQAFEGDARQLVESECRKQWSDYLKKKAYCLEFHSTTSIVKSHAFDCYIGLFHNGKQVARAFGEAKNYELLTSHLDTFLEWLSDVNFQPEPSNGHPPDLAFMIAPGCPHLLKRKLELEDIQFIEADKKADPTPTPTPDSSHPVVVEEEEFVAFFNSASKSQLRSFNQVGPKRCQAIVQERPYTSIEEIKNKLEQKIVLGQKILEQWLEEYRSRKQKGEF